jgi:4-diphosphocytidyl-2-C-methyl-D-erythritol kinase
MTLHPHAKINLGLFIKGKRPDGYHLLETLLWPLPGLHDDLDLAENGQAHCSIETTGIALDGKPEDNLCVRAWQRLRQEVPGLPGVHIRLCKRIPAGAGLGGGSADAAFVLRGLNSLFRLGFEDGELAGFAASLGADVPFFIYGQPMLASGTGTELEAFELAAGFRIELITPPIHSSTAEAYRALDYRACDPARDLRRVLAQPRATWRAALVNDLEAPVFARYPELARIKAELYAKGAFYAAMSGSGSAVFGLFEA